MESLTTTDFSNTNMDYIPLPNITDILPGDSPPKVDTNYIFWSVIDAILLVLILSGNTLTICAVKLSRKLSAVISNQFILSLAISDFIVGLTLPYHLAFYIGLSLGKHKCWCLLRFILIILACCVSIYNLIAIAIDRYIAIVHPLHYGRYMTKRMAYTIIGCGWLVAVGIATMPLYWNEYDIAEECELDEVIPALFTAGVITPTFSLIWLAMLIVYWRIWREAAGHARRLRANANSGSPSDWKSVQVVLLILGCFTICWLPYFIVACAQAFDFQVFKDAPPAVYKGVFSLAMANSGMNPIIYAWKNTSFRKAFGRLLRCKNPDSPSPSISTQRMQHPHHKASITSSNKECVIQNNEVRICDNTDVTVTNICERDTALDSNKNGIGAKEIQDIDSNQRIKDNSVITIDKNITLLERDSVYDDSNTGERDSAYESNSNSFNIHDNNHERVRFDLNESARMNSWRRRQSDTNNDIELSNVNVIENLAFEKDLNV